MRMLSAAGAVMAIGLLVTPGPARAQMCLHDAAESRDEQARRMDALMAVRSLNAAEQSAHRARGSYQPLSALSPFLAPHRSDGGQLGDVVRQMRFDRDEILPGWLARLLVDGDEYVLVLEDADDSCGFAYTSDASGMVRQGYPVGRAVPLPRQ